MGIYYLSRKRKQKQTWTYCFILTEILWFQDVLLSPLVNHKRAFQLKGNIVSEAPYCDDPKVQIFSVTSYILSLLHSYILWNTGWIQWWEPVFQQLGGKDRSNTCLRPVSVVKWIQPGQFSENLSQKKRAADVAGWQNFCILCLRFYVNHL